MTDRSSWNMARLASRRPLPKQRKVFAPVGKNRSQLCDEAGLSGAHAARYSESECSNCGFTICACASRLAREQLALSQRLAALREIPPPASERSTRAAEHGRAAWVVEQLRAGRILLCTAHDGSAAEFSHDGLFMYVTRKGKATSYPTQIPLDVWAEANAERIQSTVWCDASCRS